MGQIIKAINNIHMMCLAQQKKRKKMNKIDVRDCVEDDEGLIDELIERLETCGAVIEDLVEVAKLEPNFDRNQAYTEELLAQSNAEKLKAVMIKAAQMKQQQNQGATSVAPADGTQRITATIKGSVASEQKGFA